MSNIMQVVDNQHQSVFPIEMFGEIYSHSKGEENDDYQGDKTIIQTSQVCRKWQKDGTLQAQRNNALGHLSDFLHRNEDLLNLFKESGRSLLDLPSVEIEFNKIWKYHLKPENMQFPVVRFRHENLNQIGIIYKTICEKDVTIRTVYFENNPKGTPLIIPDWFSTFQILSKNTKDPILGYDVYGVFSKLRRSFQNENPNPKIPAQVGKYLHNIEDVTEEPVITPPTSSTQNPSANRVDNNGEIEVTNSRPVTTPIPNSRAHAKATFATALAKLPSLTSSTTTFYQGNS